MTSPWKIKNAAARPGPHWRRSSRTGRGVAAIRGFVSPFLLVTTVLLLPFLLLPCVFVESEPFFGVGRELSERREGERKEIFFH